MRINTHLQQLRGNYLFTEIANRTQAYQKAHPQTQVLRLGIGDVTLPLPPAIGDAMDRTRGTYARASSRPRHGASRLR